METEGTSLEDILNDKPDTPIVEEPAVEATETPAEPEAPADDRPRDENGRFVAKETGVEQAEVTTEAAKPVPPTEQTGLPKEEFAALKDERRKRQELEREVVELRQQFTQRQQPQEVPADFWDNPEGFMAQRFDQFGEQLLQRFQQQQLTERIDASEAAAAARYADYDDARRAFQQAAMANPSLVKQMTAASDPAEFAYTTGKRAMDLERVGSIEEILKAERAKWEAERMQPPAAPALQFPASTVTDRNVGSRTGPAWNGPTPLGDILAP